MMNMVIGELQHHGESKDLDTDCDWPLATPLVGYLLIKGRES